MGKARDIFVTFATGGIGKRVERKEKREVRDKSRRDNFDFASQQQFLSKPAVNNLMLFCGGTQQTLVGSWLCS